MALNLEPNRDLVLHRRWSEAAKESNFGWLYLDLDRPADAARNFAAAARLVPGKGGVAESAHFVAALPAITRREPIPIAAAPWAQVYAAWRNSRAPGAPGQCDAFAAVATGDREFAAALPRRAQEYRDDFRQFLAAPTGDEPAFLRTLRRQRTGYGMPALHPEGPPLPDLYIVQENRVATDLAVGLFPAKGWLPGRFLLALLPDDPR